MLTEAVLFFQNNADYNENILSRKKRDLYDFKGIMAKRMLV